MSSLSYRLALGALVVFVPLVLFVEQLTDAGAARSRQQHRTTETTNVEFGGGGSSAAPRLIVDDSTVSSVLEPVNAASAAAAAAAAAAVDRYGNAIGMSLPPLSKDVPNPKVFTTGDAGRVDWGNVVTKPLDRGSEWCEIELQDDARRAFKYDATCRADGLRQGNFTSLEDMTQFMRSFPFPQPEAMARLGADELKRYWEDNPDPIHPQCKSCAGQLAHMTPYSLRRWWRIRSWRVAKKADQSIEKLKTSVIALFQDRIGGFDAKMNGGDFDRDPAEAFSIKIADIKSLRICLEAEKLGTTSFVAIETPDEVHVLQFVLPRPGAACLWRTLQILQPDLANTRTYQVFDINAKGEKVCPDFYPVAAKMAKSLAGSGLTPAGGGSSPADERNTSRLVRMPRDETFPYLPCHRFHLAKMYSECERSNCYDKHRNFWPFKCDRHRVTNRCGWDAYVAKKSAAVSQDIRVAVSFSGFFRSFAQVRGQVWEQIVKPHNATVFAATWNVPGRAKKTVEITKKHVLPVFKMLATVKKLLYFADTESHEGRIEVYDYLRLARSHEVLKQNGFTHPGLYFTLARSILLVKEWEAKHGGGKTLFDVVVRTRFDIWPSVPLRFTRIPAASPAAAFAASTAPTDGGDPHEYVLDVGSSCQTQGAWWPQSAKFHDGKILKHNADTRYKMWTWQVCDWMEIGTRKTMYESAAIFTWAQENNVWSGAQFVDHAFLIDKRISYQPMQLYLKILRHRTQFFG